MKIPKKIKVGGFIWRIITDDKGVPHEGNAYGTTHFKSQKIFLDPENTPEKNEQALLHEQTGLVERYERDKVTRGIEEEIIQALSMGLHQVLTDNKLLK